MRFNITFCILLLAAALSIYCPENVSALIFDKSNLRHHQQNQATNQTPIVSILCMDLGDVCNFCGIELIPVGSLNTANTLPLRVATKRSSHRKLCNFLQVHLFGSRGLYL